MTPPHSPLPLTPPNSGDSVGGVIALKIQSYSWLSLITKNIYKAKSVQGKGTWAKSRGKQAQASKSPLQVESRRMHWVFPVTAHDMHQPGKLLREPEPRIFIENWLSRHPLPICTKVLDSQEESRC